jgi:hypothetical protein
MFKRAALLTALAALALPALAAATSYDPSTRLGLLGKGDVSADLTAGTDAKPVRIAVVGGSLTITPVSDDVKITCRSRADGKASTSCTGNAVLATVTGSHFQIQATGKLFLFGIPQGYSGSVDAATAKQCGKEIDCRRALQVLRQRARNAGNGNGNGNANGNGNGNTTAGGDGTITAAPGTDESLAQLQAALAALGKSGKK